MPNSLDELLTYKYHKHDYLSTISKEINRKFILNAIKHFTSTSISLLKLSNFTVCMGLFFTHTVYISKRETQMTKTIAIALTTLTLLVGLASSANAEYSPTILDGHSNPSTSKGAGSR